MESKAGGPPTSTAVPEPDHPGTLWACIAAGRQQRGPITAFRES
jgi:hypothetical protein